MPQHPRCARRRSVPSRPASPRRGRTSIPHPDAVRPETAVRSMVRFGPATSISRSLVSPSVVKQYRLNRLFHPTSGRCFDVAVDHGMPGEASMLAGIEDMEKAIDVLVDAKPDAIQLSVGQADLLQRHPGRDKPALVLRTDTPNIYARRGARGRVVVRDRRPRRARRPPRRRLRRHQPARRPRPGRPAPRLPRGHQPAARRVRPRGDAADGRAARVRARRGRRLPVERRRRPHHGPRPPGGRARRRHHQGRPHRRPRPSTTA